MCAATSDEFISLSVSVEAESATSVAKKTLVSGAVATHASYWTEETCCTVLRVIATCDG